MKDNNISENVDPERDIFTDPAIALSREASDPVGEFIKRQWRPLLIAVVVAFLLVYARDTFRESGLRSQREGANAFFESQEALKRYRETSQKIDELKAKKEPTETETKDLQAAEAELKTRQERLDQSLVILGDSAMPYKKFAPIIAALAAHDRGNLEEVRRAIGVFDPNKIDELKGNERFIMELSLLTLARAVLDFPEGESQARSILIALAQKGETVAVSAMMTLSNLATTDLDKVQVKEMMSVLAKKYPEQAATLKE